MNIIEGDLSISSYGRRHIINGFTYKDMRRLQILARKVYKIKSKKKRILKKYVAKLLIDSIKALKGII